MLAQWYRKPPSQRAFGERRGAVAAPSPSTCNLRLLQRPDFASNPLQTLRDDKHPARADRTWRLLGTGPRAHGRQFASQYCGANDAEVPLSLTTISAPALNFGYPTRFPVHAIKIDREFVAQIGINARSPIVEGQQGVDWARRGAGHTDHRRRHRECGAEDHRCRTRVHAAAGILLGRPSASGEVSSLLPHPGAPLSRFSPSQGLARRVERLQQFRRSFFQTFACSVVPCPAVFSLPGISST